MQKMFYLIAALLPFDPPISSPFPAGYCSGNGACVLGACQCFPGFAGADCGSAADGGPGDGLVLSGWARYLVLVLGGVVSTWSMILMYQVRSSLSKAAVLLACSSGRLLFRSSAAGRAT